VNDKDGDIDGRTINLFLYVSNSIENFKEEKCSPSFTKQAKYQTNL